MTVQQWQSQPLAPVAVSANIVRLVDAFKESEAAYALAERLVQTSFCPTAFKGKPGEAAAAMMAGSEIGLSPLAALGAFDVIEGRAAARAITLRAVVQARGHEIELQESTDTRCKMRGRRRGSEAWQSVLWTIDRAKTMGLTSKQNWQKQPQAMLIARATSELGRLIASDALLGLGGGYSSEELADGEYPAPVVTQAPAAAPEPRRTLAYRQPQAVVQEPAEAEVIDQETGEVTPPPAPRTLRRRPTQERSVEDQQTEIRDLKQELRDISDEAAPDEPQPTVKDPSKLTTAQRGKIMALFTKLELSDRDERLRYCGMVIGREIDSSNDLSKIEAHQIIENLEGMAGPIDAREALDADSIDVSSEPDED
jgi:hypothetical protein